MNPKLKKLFRSSWRTKLLATRVMILLGVGRMSVLLIPFKKIATWLGESQQETNFEKMPSEQDRLIRLRQVIGSVSKYTFWKSNCFAQALCAHWILKGRGIMHTIYFGVTTDEDKKLKAHAWLRAGDLIITGAMGHREYTVVGKFSCLASDKSELNSVQIN